MEITDIRVHIPNARDKKLLAFASVTFDNQLVLKEIRVLDGRSGWFISMPARKKDFRCGSCFMKNHVMAKFCNECGGKVTAPPPPPVEDGQMEGKRSIYIDIAHPITPDFRDVLQNAILDAYEAEMEKLKALAATPEAPQENN